MTQHTPRAPLGDFFEPVRRRHPDLDIVVLPDGPDQPPADPVTDEQVFRERTRVAELVGRCWAAAVGRSEPGLSEPDRSRIRFGAAPGSVVATAGHRARGAEDASALQQVADRLQQEGARVRWSQAGLPRVVGHLDGIRVEATYAAATGVLVLAGTSDAIHVGPQRARGLVRG